MKVVLLSGGKGKRLWPLSVDSMPKQFLKVYKDSESMLNKTYNLLANIYDNDNIYISTSEEYVDSVKKELNINNNIIIEPQGIGTFGAIVNISMYFKMIKECPDNTEIAVVPIDHNVDDSFYNILELAKEKLKKNDICLIGIKPTFISTQYGYIISNNGIVGSFKEKPNIIDATNLINNGALWNSGIVLFKLKKLVEIAERYNDCCSYDEFISNYSKLPHNSFDIEVLEKEKNIAIVESKSTWNDIGTWQNLSPLISIADNYNTDIINMENKEIRNDGVKDIILINSTNGIRIVPKNKTNFFLESWGTREVLNNFSYFNISITIEKLSIFNNIENEINNNQLIVFHIIKGKGQMNVGSLKRKFIEQDEFFVDKNNTYSVYVEENVEMLKIILEYK